MLPAAVKRYLLAGLTGTPDVLDSLLNNLPPDDPAWDRRPDPERFTIREVLAHLADWEPIFLERLTRVRDHQPEPVLQGYDEGRIALERDYAHSDPLENLSRFRQGRTAVMLFLRTTEDADWQKAGRHTEVGPITLEQLAVLIVGHDGYHAQQIALWLADSGH